MKNNLLIASGFCLFLVFYGCVSTEIVNSWRDPSVTLKPGDMKKVLVIAMVQNESSRRTVENKLVSLMPQTQGVPSYSYLTKEDVSGDLNAAKEKVKKDGFDGVVTMRLVKIEKETNYVPGTYPSYFYSPWSYGAYAFPMYYDAGHYTVDDIYHVETNLYTLNPEKLVWTGVTSTFNPQKVDATVQEIAEVIKDKMVDEGFFVEAPKK